MAFEQVPLATRRIRIFGGTRKPWTWIVKVGLLSIGPILIDSRKACQSPCIIKVLAKVFPNAAGSPAAYRNGFRLATQAVIRRTRRRLPQALNPFCLFSHLFGILGVLAFFRLTLIRLAGRGGLLFSVRV